MKRLSLLCLISVAGIVLVAYTVCSIVDRSNKAGTTGHTAQQSESGTFDLDSVKKSATSIVSAKQIDRARHQPYIVIDRYSNRLFLRTADSVLLDLKCSTGSGGVLLDSTTGRLWKFDTPAGVYTVHSMLENPWWRKPDWAYVEERQPIPKHESERLDNQMMGDYAIGFGDGYYIHGTIYERLLGIAVTHGCVRLAAGGLEDLYERVRIGTLIFVF